MDGDGPGWVPPRPGREGTLRELPGVSVVSPPPVPQALPTPAPAPRRRGSPGRRLLLAYAAGAALIGLVVAAGAVLQPVYGSEAPYGGTPYPDVRSVPTTSGWSVPLQRVFAPGVPAECLTYQAKSVSATRELVSATLPSETPMGPNDQCSVNSPATDGRLVMVDPATGSVLWRRSLASELDTTVLSLVWHASKSAGVVVVGIDGTRGDFLLSLSLRTGRTLSSTTVSSPDAVINFAVSDHLVESIVPGSGGTVNSFTLRRTNDLGHPLWSQSISSALLPQLLPDRFVVPLSTGTVSVDGVTGVQRSWGADLRQLTSVRVTGDRVLAQTDPSGVGLAPSVVLLDSAGHVLWVHPAPSITGLTVSRGCVLVTSGVIELSCLDPASGRVRWSTRDDGIVLGTPSGSTTSDIESIGNLHAGDTTLVLSELDGVTGRVRFETTLPRGTDVSGQGVATGYALGNSSPDGMSTLTAFDLDSGEVLWSLHRSQIDLWGGHLVEITKDGVARELVVTGSRAGRSGARHDMLVG